MSEKTSKKPFESFDLGIEQASEGNGLQFFFGAANKTFPGLTFSNIEGISTLGEEVMVSVKGNTVITIRSDGFCKWE